MTASHGSQQAGSMHSVQMGFKRRMTRVAAVAAVVLTGLFVTGTTRAAIVYGDFAGATVDYVNVTEDNQGLYGAPVVTGDTITFSPVDFEIQSSGAVPPQLLDATVTLVIDAKDGHQIESFSINEAGAYNLLGIGTDVTRVIVGAAVVVNVLEVDGVAVPGGSLLADTFTFADFNLADDGPAFAAPWTGGAVIDIQALALSAGITGDVTKVSLSINNTLAAFSEAGTTSFIDKKAINGLSITVPEPASLALAGLGVLAVFRRRAA